MNASLLTKASAAWPLAPAAHACRAASSVSSTPSTSSPMPASSTRPTTRRAFATTASRRARPPTAQQQQQRTFCSGSLWSATKMKTSAASARKTAIPAADRRPFHATAGVAASMKDPYKVLGVDKSASAAQVKKAYYGLAKKFHPDTNKDATAKDRFAEVQAAYELLSDPKRREQFDQFGFDPAASGAGGPGGPGGGPGGNPFAGGGNPFAGGGFGSNMNFEDLFHAFTGGQAPGGGRRGGGGRGPFQQQEVLVGDNIEVQASISFLEAARGVAKSLTITPLVTCRTCTGSGLKTGTKRTSCSACGGSGSRVHFIHGGFQMASTCGACGGVGTSVPRGGECRTCGGDGAVRERTTINVDIPGGVEDGMRLRVDGQGDAALTGRAGGADAGVRGMRGDLYVFVRVAADPKFRREGADLLHTAAVPLTTAVLGGEVTVPTLDGNVKVRVATGTSTGDRITLAGLGMQKLGSGRRRGAAGDLLVEFKVAMPKYLTANQRTILEMLADEMDDKTAKRVMNLRRSSGDDSTGSNTHQNEGFLKSIWHNLTNHPAHQRPADENPGSTGSTGSTDKKDSKDGKDGKDGKGSSSA